ncbi:MAG: bifunctional riboflavin kinase/FAD synthetase [Chloroflexota bacterium]|nr:bifunctional riboflavin kinase/FAD synthetase [Chloroflexota bacterium]MDE2940775.1 bifunctional riboflavin kinase/FAD synthetase [Chloroflexota bacterium]MDE3266957.1 bifunctional riboflavin kinase/FAD synthetase [Chloroflexota bacterium]
MQLLRELPEHPPKESALLTIGVFDGVHLGHRYLLERLREAAAREGALSAVLTFTNHPRTVIRPGDCVPYITPVDDRLELLRQEGVDLVIPLTFDEELSRLKAHEFVDLLRERVNMGGLVMGNSFAMGHQRGGTPETLAQMGRDKGFSTTVVESASSQGEEVSSTAIREAITSGDVSRASRMLGRKFVLRGEVVRGQARGRELGFPTANLDLPECQVVPGNGVYAARAVVDGAALPAAVNIGVRPTFGDGERMVEVHILDYVGGDLYGSKLAVEFVERLRDELRFGSVEELVAQMSKDVEQSRQILGQLPSATDAR